MQDETTPSKADAPEVREFTVATWAVASVEAAVRSLARAARRAGLSPEPSLSIDWTTQREMKQTRNETTIADGEVVDESSAIAVVPVVTCRISLPGGSAEAHGDWGLLATLQRVDGDATKGEITNDIFTAPKDLPQAEAWRHACLACDHCKARRTRTKTVVVVEKKTGATKQVGKECAAAYLGNNLERAVSELEFKEFVGTILSDFEPGEEGYFGGGGKGGRKLTAWDAEEFMANAVACVRERGWQPSTIKGTTDRYGYDTSGPNPDATAVHVKDTLLNGHVRVARLAEIDKEVESHTYTVETFNLGVIDPESSLGRTMTRHIEDERAAVVRLKAEKEALLKPKYTVTEADRTEATKLIDWLARQTPDPEKDKYLAELQAIFSAGFISEKRLGFAVSGVRAQVNAERTAAMKAKAASSQFVGTPGAREDFRLRLTSAHHYDGQFPGVAYRLEDPSGNLFSLLSNSYPFPGDLGTDEPIGKEYLVKATVKKHEVYREAKTTMLSRLKVLKVLEPEIQPAPATALEPEGAEVPPGGPPPVLRPLSTPKIAAHLEATPTL